MIGVTVKYYMKTACQTPITQTSKFINSFESATNQYDPHEWWLFDSRQTSGKTCPTCLALHMTHYRGDEIHAAFPYHRIIRANRIKAMVHPHCRCVLVWTGRTDLIENKKKLDTKEIAEFTHSASEALEQANKALMELQNKHRELKETDLTFNTIQTLIAKMDAAFEAKFNKFTEYLTLNKEVLQKELELLTKIDEALKV